MIERDVAELRARVAKLERAVAFFERHLRVTFVDDADSGVSPDVLALVRRGDKLAAIRLHCQNSGASLAEAKRIIDSIE
ncbi:MAG: hypothetical protein IT379_23060 [Deltaproteobacteria bacterium]|nr:hypothetical protein [Deltaproteobacteria bacterium]